MSAVVPTFVSMQREARRKGRKDGLAEPGARYSYELGSIYTPFPQTSPHFKRRESHEHAHLAIVPSALYYVYGRTGLGHERQGQGWPGARGQCVPLHHLQGPVRSCETADALPRTQEGSPPATSGAPTCSAVWSSATRATGAFSGRDTKSGPFAYYICGTLFREGVGTCSARYLNAPRVEAFVVEPSSRCGWGFYEPTEALVPANMVRQSRGTQDYAVGTVYQTGLTGSGAALANHEWTFYDYRSCCCGSQGVAYSLPMR